MKFWRHMVKIMSNIDQSKLDKMWKKILQYEKEDGILDKDKTAVDQIMKIIDEVYSECY